MTRRLFRIVAVVVCLVAPNARIAAQQKSSAAPRTEWYPRTHPDVAPRLDAADNAVIESVLGRVEQLIHGSVYRTTHGFEAEPWWYWGKPGDRTHLAQYSFGLITWVPTYKLSGGDGGPVVTITVNPDPGAWTFGVQPIADERGDTIWIEPRRAPNQFGSTMLWGTFYVDNAGPGFTALFTAGGESPTIPVTREEYLRLRIFQIESQPSPYKEFLAQAPDRKKALEETLAIIAARDKAQAEKMRADAEKAEREFGEQMRKGQEEVDAHPPAEPYRKQIAVMSPAERAAPAYVGNELLPMGSTDGFPLVRRNQAFYRARRSPLEPRAILVWIPIRPMSTAPLIEQHKRFFEEFDWAAIKRLVEER